MKILIIIVLFINSAFGVTLTLSAPGELQKFPLFKEGKDVLLSVYEELGIPIKVVSEPPLRAITNSNRGVYDLELLRLPVIENYYHNLIRVPCPIFKDKLVLYYLKSNTSWYLKDKEDITVGFIRGGILTNKLSEEYKVLVVHSLKALIKIFKEERVDMIAWLNAISSQDLQELTDKGEIGKIHYSDMALYHYVHKKHKNLIPKIVTALDKELKNLDPLTSKLNHKGCRI